MIQRRELNPVFVIVVLIMFVVVVALVVYEQQGQRKIPVHYAKRVIGRGIYGAQNTYLPFKINPSGVIPVIFASSILVFPLQIASNLGGTRGVAAALRELAAPQRRCLRGRLRRADHLLRLLLHPGDA